MLSFSTRTFETDSGTRSALIVTPTEHVRVMASRLEELQTKVEEETTSPIDLRLLAEGQRRAKEVDVTIFRGLDDAGQGSWGFEPDLEEETAQELAYYLLRDQLFSYRRLFDTGLYLNFHVEWPQEELAYYRYALNRLRDEIDPSAQSGVFGPEPDQSTIDRWILRNGVFFFHISLDKLLTETLPERWPMLQRRLERVRRIG